MWLRKQTVIIHASARIWPEIPRIKTIERPLVFAMLPNGSATRRAIFESNQLETKKIVISG